MKILLIYPPNDLRVGNRRISDAICPYQPLGLSYIAAVLEKAGYEVRIVDAKIERLSIDKILNRVVDFKPRIVGISCPTPDFCIVKSLAKQIKSSGNYITLIGGVHVTALPEETIEEGCFDYGILGEGEQTVIELANAICQNKTSEILDIKGIIFRDGSRIVRTSARPYIENLDTLPFPARHLLPSLGKYTHLSYKHLPIAAIITSRGCPYQCIFCDHSVFGHKVRMRSIENILNEIETLVEDYGVREVDIIDDLFTLNPHRVTEFCQQLISRKLKISWGCVGRVDCITEDMLKTMKKAGCWMIGYGIESGNQRILDGIKKNATIEKAKMALEWTAKTNIQTAGFFILGLPGENETTMRHTLEFAKSLPLDRVVFHIAQPYPGTELHKITLAQGKLKRDVEYRNYHNYGFPDKLPYIADGLSVDILRRYRKKAYRDFYLRPSYIFRCIFKHPEFKGFLRRMIFFLKAIF